MKFQLKLDKKSLQQFFLDHTEKIVFGLVVFCFLMFVYGALGRKGYADPKGVVRRPEDLQASAANAKKWVDDADKRHEITLASLAPDYDLAKRSFATVVGRSRELLDANLFAINTPWYARVFHVRGKRDMPKVLPLVDLRGESGRGAVAMKAPAGPAVRVAGAKGSAPASAEADSVRGQRWVVLTGVVPLESQMVEYRNRLQSAAGFDPAKDAPEYLGFFVQRAEVRPDASGPPDWTGFYSTKTMDEARAAWTKTDAEVVAEKYVRPTLCSPLPVVTGHRWSLEAACPPRIKLKSNDTAGAAAEQPVEPTKPAGGGIFGQAAAAKPATTIEKPAEKEADCLLFRVFDFDVKPGKQYRYRVFLVLRNPNYGFDPKDLLDSEFANSLYLGKGQETRGADGSVVNVKINEAAGKWSDPTPPIAVPEDIEILLCKVSKRGAQEPMGLICVTKWIERLGLKTFEEFDRMVRGKEADFKDCKWPHAGSRRSKDHSETKITVNYITGQLLLDMTGGEELNPADKTLTRPAELLLRDAAGHLVIHDELADREIFRQYTDEKHEGADTGTEPPPPGPGPKPKPIVKPGPPDEEIPDIFDHGKKKSSTKAGKN